MDARLLVAPFHKNRLHMTMYDNINLVKAQCTSNMCVNPVCERFNFANN
jgi:hypothetical protein